MSANSTQNPPTIQDLCSQLTLPSFAAQVAFLTVILIITIVGNLVVCMTVLFTQSLRIFTNYIVASLAVSDLMVGSMSLPFRIYQTLHNTHWCLGESACRFWICADLFCCCASVGNLSLISLDRFLATKYPLTYINILSGKTKTIMISTVWVYAIVVASTGLINWTNPGSPVVLTTNGCFKPDPYFYTFAACVGFFLPLMVIVIAYSYVFKVSVGHWRAIRRLTVPALDYCQPRNSHTNQRRALTREIKAAKTLAIVVGAFVFCWAPFFFILLAKFWCGSCFQSHGNITLEGFFMFVNITFIYTLPNINSTLNPFIYVIFSKRLRQAFVRLFYNLTNKVTGRTDGLPLGRGRENGSISGFGRTNAARSQAGATVQNVPQET